MKLGYGKLPYFSLQVMPSDTARHAVNNKAEAGAI
jgi:hypothetical protein